MKIHRMWQIYVFKVSSSFLVKLALFSMKSQLLVNYHHVHVLGSLPPPRNTWETQRLGALPMFLGISAVHLAPFGPIWAQMDPNGSKWGEMDGGYPKNMPQT